MLKALPTAAICVSLYPKMALSACRQVPVGTIGKAAGKAR